MPRRSKRVKNIAYEKKTTIHPNVLKDCVSIGKENIERWINFKNTFRFSSDNEFASYLLDLFDREKSYSANKDKEENGKKPNTSLSGTSITCLNGSSTSMSAPLQINDSQVGSNSSVIVVNKAIRVDHPCNEENKNNNDKKVVQSPNPDYTSNTQDINMNIRHKKAKKKKIEDRKNHLLLDKKKTLKLKKKKLKNQEGCLSNLRSNCENEQEIVEEELVSPALPSMKFEAVEVVNSNPPVSNEKSNNPMIEEMRPLPTDSGLVERVSITIRLCPDCELHHVQDACPLRKPIGVVSDAVSQNEFMSGRLESDLAKSYAEASLPPCLALRVIDPKHGPSVVAAHNVPAFTQFGPLVGQPIKEMEIPDDSTMEHIWELSDSTSCQYLTTSDTNQSNWLRYVRPAAVRSSRNVEVVLRDHQLMFITTAPLTVGEELFFWAENTNTAWSHKKLCKTKCGGCNLSFSHTIYYRLHCAVFHDPQFSLTVRKYHCKVCGMSVLGKENIVKHAADKHNGKGAYQCQFCHKFFLRLNYLEMHRTYGCSANPNRARPLCDYCGRKFCQPQKLKVHIKRMHSEMIEVLRDFQCKHCSKLLGSRAALQRHFKEVHQKDVVGAFTCDRCGKMFQNKSNLKIHMLTHSGIKPFKCIEADCSAAFTTKQCLQFHYRKIHGLEESRMPRIERTVEYTFDAYAGSRRPNSVNSDSQCSSDGEDTPPEKYSNEDTSQLSPPISVTGDVSKPPLEMYNKVIASKGSKKWMGEEEDPGKSRVFEFEDDKEQDLNVSQIEDEPTPMLFHHSKQDSSNASLLVEAAIDAAERDIDIPSKVPSPMSLVTNKEPYPVLRAQLTHSPLSLSRPVSPIDYPIQDQSQSPHLAIESCYPSAMSPRHPYNLMFPERTSHYDFHLSPPPSQMDTFHLDESRYDIQHRRTDENSGDESANVAQNLSLGLKSKSLQLDPYKYDTLDERSFECVEGLDMSRTGSYHHSFVSLTPRYPHTLYEPRTYSHTDVLRVVNFSHSVDLSLPRSHHQLTPPINNAIIEPVRIISPPPPPYQAYPLSTSPYNRPPPSPTYHHYSTTY